MATAPREKFIAFGCLHCPLVDEEAVDWLKETIVEEQPDVVVCLGDAHEADSASRWPSEYEWSLADEFESVNRTLESVREVCPGARHIFLPGNHDDNLLAINRINKKLRGLCDYRRQPELLPELFPANELWEQPADYVMDRERGCFRLGQVTFTHGYITAAGSDMKQAIMFAEPNGLLVSAHTHRPAAVEQATYSSKIDLPYWSANTGTLRDIWEVEYMRRKDRTKWGQGLVVGEVAITKGPRSGRTWDAETRIFRGYYDR